MVQESFIIVSYFTRDTIYQNIAESLKDSLSKFNIPNDVSEINSLGNWYKNTNFKPTFLKEMLKKHYPKSIVWVDCDAVFNSYPYFFNTIETERKDLNIAVYRYHNKLTKQYEILSGTIFLRNTKESVKLVESWEKECKSHPTRWDQKSLEKVLTGAYISLPPEYCKIFDKMEEVTQPVIVHNQASRTVRKNNMRIG